jgi:YjjG family noncanonical pyrimidine nucleotidase
VRYPYLLFDADHTLYDFDLAQYHALESTLLELHGSFDTDHLEVYDEVNRRLWHAFELGEIPQEDIKRRRFEHFIARLDLHLDPDEMNDLYLQRLSEGHFLLEGAFDLVAELALGRVLAIVTNGLREVQRPRFTTSPIAEYLEAIVVSDEIGIAKPNPGIFDAAFEALGGPEREDVLMIGDSLTSDMRGGIDYGIDTCWFNPDHRMNELGLPVTYEIQRYDELRELLRG